MVVRVINNENLIFPILQKYYSTLEQLNNLNATGDIFENISKVDTFFMEFRNITFVMQKAFSTKELKQYYDEKRAEYLLNSDMKWFVDKRNAITKEEPFKLEKDISIDIYLPFGQKINLERKITVDNDYNFETLFEELRKELLSYSEYMEAYFCIELIFRENGSEINIYEKVKKGIEIVNKFVNNVIKDYPCNSDKCYRLIDKIIKSYRKVMCKDISFIWDGAIEDGRLVFGEIVEHYFKIGQQDFVKINDINVQIRGEIFGKEDECEISLFKKLTFLHLHIYKDQNNDIMPVFMFVYEDDTISFMPFIATIKATFYRMVSNAKRIIRDKPVRSVFFISEQYIYGEDKFSSIQKPYKERIKLADETILSCIMISKLYTSMLNIDFHVDKVDDMDYVYKQLNNITQNTYQFLQPILEVLKL